MDTNSEIFAFVLMPFDSAFDDIYKIGIKETAHSLGLLAERVDEQIFREGILERIYRQIELADLIVADMTGQNANVFYEVGYAHAKGKLCILLTQNADDIPFDLKHHRHIVYGNSISDLRSMLLEALEWAKTQIDNVRLSHIKVTVKDVSGVLTKTKYIASTEVSFKIDLNNNSLNTSSEIDAIYFYSSKDWTLEQELKNCPSTDSDLPNFYVRHFLQSPVRRLNRQSWAQLTFSAKRTLARATKGQELKNEYRLTGKALIRLVTVDGNYDYEFSLDLTVRDDDIPF